jgi:hypothetical protein
MQLRNDAQFRDIPYALYLMRHQIAPAFENQLSHRSIQKIALDIELSVNRHLTKFDLTLKEVIPIHVTISVSNSDDVVLI